MAVCTLFTKEDLISPIIHRSSFSIPPESTYAALANSFKVVPTVLRSATKEVNASYTCVDTSQRRSRSSQRMARSYGSDMRQWSRISMRRERTWRLSRVAIAITSCPPISRSFPTGISYWQTDTARSFSIDMIGTQRGEAALAGQETETGNSILHMAFASTHVRGAILKS